MLKRCETRYVRANFHQDGICREGADAGDVGQINAGNAKHLASEIEVGSLPARWYIHSLVRGGISSGPPRRVAISASLFQFHIDVGE